jgi:hypothetical protein
MQTGLFLLQVSFAGGGSTTNNIKLIPNGYGLKKWNHDVVLGFFGDASRGKINRNVIL